MKRFNQRQGFLVSAILHLTILMMLWDVEPSKKAVPIEPSDQERKVVLLSPAEIRRMLPQPTPRPQVRPTPPPPAPTPPPQSAKDRISVGPPTEDRTKRPMILRREDDLTKVPKGTPQQPNDAPQTPPPSPPPASATPAPQVAQREPVQEAPGRPGLRLPPGVLGTRPRGDEGTRPSPPSSGLQRSTQDAMDSLARRVERDSRAGLPTGTGRNIAGLNFDPQGADFTLWVNRFKDEVYRNWVPPEAAMLGMARGHVDFEFVVERDGTMSSLRLIKSSGTPSLDKAAQYALSSSRLLPLPDDYGPPRVTMQVSFYYNEAPQSS